MKLKIGFIKDIFAVYFFLTSIIILLINNNLDRYKNLMLYFLFIGFFTDSFFSTNSKYHCLNFDHNGPTYILLLAIILVIFGLLYYINLIKNNKNGKK